MCMYLPVFPLAVSMRHLLTEFIGILIQESKIPMNVITIIIVQELVENIIYWSIW